MLGVEVPSSGIPVCREFGLSQLSLSKSLRLGECDSQREGCERPRKGKIAAQSANSKFEHSSGKIAA